MRLAVAFWEGIYPDQAERVVARLTEIGTRGTVLVPSTDGFSDDDLRNLAQVFDDAGCFIAEIAHYRDAYLASNDWEQRSKGLAAAKRSIQHARILGPHCVGLSSPWGAEGSWWTRATWIRLIESLSELALHAEEAGVQLALHPSNQGPLDSPEQLRTIIDDVGSSHLNVMLDVVNMCTPRACCNTTDFLNRTFDLLGDDVIGAHAKDVALDRDHWVVKIDEVPLGTGTLDYETLLQRLDYLADDTVLTIEHSRDLAVSGSYVSPNYAYLPGDAENTRARRYIHEVARRIGIQLD